MTPYRQWSVAVKIHGGIIMNQNVVIAIVLGALVLIAAVEAYQLMSLKDKISSGGVQVATAGAPAPQAAGGGAPTLPSSLENLPSMVGGC